MFSFYLTDGNNRYGFYVDTGIFFVNNINYDIKIKKENEILIPFQYKTNQVVLQSNQDSLISQSVGYEIKEKKEKYTMLITDRNVTIIAERINSDGEMRKKSVIVR